MSRTGKIARLPKNVREQLNQRLQDGEPGPKLVSWLNGLPEVNEIMADRFGSRPINEVNLTEWRKGGFLDWERHEEARALVCNAAERAQDLEGEAAGLPIADHIAALLATELMLYSETVFRETADPKERWDRLRSMLQEVSRLRREDHRAARLAIEKQRWEWETVRLEQEQLQKEVKASKAKMMAPLHARMHAELLAEVLGGSAEAMEAAKIVAEEQYDLKPGTLSKGPKPEKPVGPEAAEAKDPAPQKKTKKVKAKVRSRKRAASAARRKQRNRRRPARSTKTGHEVDELAETVNQPEPDFEPGDGLEQADTTQTVAEETEAPHIAPEKQEPPGEGPETREN